MGIGGSILLIAVGAILAFAVDYEISGVELDVVGWILMIVGVVGLLASMVVWGTRRRRGVVEERTYDREPPLA